MISDLDLIDHNAERVNRKSALYVQNQLETPEPTKRGYYAGYDPALGKHKVTLSDGSTVYGKMISNGAVQLTNRVAITIPGEGTAFFKVTPQ
jgi:hypothetical protein